MCSNQHEGTHRYNKNMTPPYPWQRPLCSLPTRARCRNGGIIDTKLIDLFFLSVSFDIFEALRYRVILFLFLTSPHAMLQLLLTRLMPNKIWLYFGTVTIKLLLPLVWMDGWTRTKGNKTSKIERFVSSSVKELGQLTRRL